MCLLGRGSGLSFVIVLLDSVLKHYVHDLFLHIVALDGKKRNSSCTFN